MPGKINVADLYWNGLGVSKDSAAARSWYQKAADQGDQFALDQLNKLK